MEEVTEVVFVTYNIDSKACDSEKRLDSFINLIKSNPPDVLAIQEAKQEQYEKLTRELKHFGYKYRLPSVVQKRKVGELLFSKFPIKSFVFVPYVKSAEGRGLSVVCLDRWEKTLYAATTQLETNTALRNAQLKELERLISTLKHPVILGGDMRIMSYEKGISFPSGWMDAWHEAGSSSNKLTIDCDTNLLAAHPFRDRPDRVFSTAPFDPVEYDLYGVEEEPVISSHYGIRVKYHF